MDTSLTTIGRRRALLVAIQTSWLSAVVFSANGERLVTGNDKEVRMWQMVDGREMAALSTRSVVYCLAVSANGRWMAAGTQNGEVFVWNVETHEQAFRQKEDYRTIYGVDFSPDSTRLVTAPANSTVSVWNVVSSQRVLLLPHDRMVRAAKYSLQGDRIATATQGSIRVYDGGNGHLLWDVKVTVTPSFNNGLVWFKDHLLVISDNKIKQIEASTGSAVSEWAVPDADDSSCITQPKHKRFIVYSTRRTVSFWDTLTHARLGLIERPQEIRSIALSPDDQCLAMGGEDGKVVIEDLSGFDASTCDQVQQDEKAHFAYSTPNLPRVQPTFQEQPYRRRWWNMLHPCYWAFSRLQVSRHIHLKLGLDASGQTESMSREAKTMSDGFGRQA